jgi:S1-C subfamily serine protease
MGFYNSVIAAWKMLFMGVVVLLHIIAGFFNAQLTYAPPASPQATQDTGLHILATSTSPAATSTPTQKTTAAASPAAKKIIPQTQPANTPTPPPAFTAESGQAANLAARAALVNILCTTGGGGYFNPISGSGVVVDGRGIILTNAHVGQFFLLRDYGGPDNVDCTIRTGSPAASTYRAELLFLPPRWIAANASKISSQDPTGTGQDDYSLLLITGIIAPGGTLPSTFPALPLSLEEPQVGEEVLLAAYPAGLLGGETIQQNLYQSSAFSTIGALYSFNELTHVDLFSLAGSVVSQSGSSGGAVVDPTGGLAGIIATAEIGTTTARDLNAITLTHIDRSLREEGQGGLLNILAQPNVAQAAADFNKNTAPAETAALESYLPK